MKLRSLFISILVLVALCGCDHHQDKWRAEYPAIVERWDAAYSGPDAKVAYDETLAYVEYLKTMQKEGVPFDVRRVLIWTYPRLGLLAEHLKKSEESKQFFAIAARYAKACYPNEPDSAWSEASFRSALDQMDTPDKVAWRKK
jgi:hypothetical protein